MILPLGDTPNPTQYRPWVTWVLMAINCAVYVLITLPLSAMPALPDDPRLAHWLRAVAPHLGPADVAVVASQLTAWDLAVFEHGFVVRRQFVDHDVDARPRCRDVALRRSIHAALVKVEVVTGQDRCAEGARR